MQNNKPIVFISYSHKNEQNNWVTKLANMIENHQVRGIPQIRVIYDQDEGELGKHIYNRIQDLISQATVVLVILTPEYKEKADKGFAFVGYEYNLIRGELFKDVEPRKKCIPILKEGALKESMPEDLYSLIGIDMSSLEKLNGGFINLLQSISKSEFLNDPKFNNNNHKKNRSTQFNEHEQKASFGTTVFVSMIAGTALTAAIVALGMYEHQLTIKHHELDARIDVNEHLIYQINENFRDDHTNLIINIHPDMSHQSNNYNTDQQGHHDTHSNVHHEPQFDLAEDNSIAEDDHLIDDDLTDNNFSTDDS